MIKTIFIDPWKDIDYQSPFDLPENLFFIKGSDVKLPIKKEISFLSAGNSIKRIFLKGIEIEIE